MIDSAALKDLFLIKKDITYLNFGAYGSCPKPIFEAYQQFQLELETEPTVFVNETGPSYLKAAREALATYLHCHADELVYVTNPSYAVNIIAKSLKIGPGDEVLTTNLEYGPCDKTLNFYCEQTGATYIRQKIKFPLESKEDFIAQFCAGISSKTKLIFISHLTSSTALRLPVEEICAIANERGIMVYVDGAHAPGQLPINLTTLGADIYTGACHKWMMTPKGSSFLYVKKELHHLFEPLVISWGYKTANPSGSLLIDNHQLQGTRDYAAFLTIPKAIEFMQIHHWDQVSNYCRKLSQDNAERFCDLIGTQPNSPINDEFIGQLFSIPIQIPHPEKLHDHLYASYKIQVPVPSHEGQFYLRYSLQGFNSQSDLDQLYDAMKTIISK
jgi:isopenicillin-N epimerase